jgi:hypothetical protein
LLLLLLVLLPFSSLEEEEEVLVHFLSPQPVTGPEMLLSLREADLGWGGGGRELAWRGGGGVDGGGSGLDGMNGGDSRSVSDSLGWAGRGRWGRGRRGRR